MNIRTYKEYELSDKIMPEGEIMKQSEKYTAVLGGSSWRQGPKSHHRTITEARRWAESYGTMADYCNIYKGARLIARHVRSTDNDGTRWYKVPVK